MNAEFLARLTEATNSLRKNDIGAATRTIQSALSNSRGRNTPDVGNEAPVLEGSVASSGQRPRSDSGMRPRRKLADVVRIMRNCGVEPIWTPTRGAGLALKRVDPDPLPPGATFTQHTFSCAAGTRRYKLYKPSADEGRGQGLIIMLHGCTQTPDDFAIGTRMNSLAHKHGILVAYPEQVSKANQLKCWNWFNPGDQRRDTGEPSILAGLTREITAKHAIDPGRVYVAGLSSGGAMAAVLGATYPEIFCGIGIHSGLPHGAAYDVPSAFEAMRTGHCNRVEEKPYSRSDKTRTIIFHGDNDGTVHPANGVSLFQRACDSGNLSLSERRHGEANNRSYKIQTASDGDGRVMAELWAIGGGGHAWSGGDNRGTYADPSGPCASEEMLRFFLEKTTWRTKNQ